MARWLVFLLGCGQNLPAASNFYPNNDTGIGLQVNFAQCRVLATGQAIVLTVEVVSGARVALEVETTAGTRVLQRLELADGEAAPLTVPPEALALGRQRVRVSVYAAQHRSQSVAADYIIVTPRPTGAVDDADGDCYSPRLGDCDDTSAAINPGAIEVCDDRVENNCDGSRDAEDAQCSMCADSDGDGHAAAYCGGDDCDDSARSAYAGAPELCDGRDNDCDGGYDETFDADGDGFVFCANGNVDIVRDKTGAPCPPGYANCSDCLDSDATRFPGDERSSCAD